MLNLIADYFSIIFSILSISLIASTAYDVISRHRQREPHKLYITFSVYTNGAKLFDITQNTSPNNIQCFNGIRALSVLWIIFGHRISYQQGFPLANRLEVADFYENFIIVIFTAHHLAVDTFFLMAGLLVTWSVMNAQERKKLNIPKMIYRRYIRYTPVFAVLILYMVSIAKYSITGPEIWDLSANCRRYWWAALLHIQNYVDPMGMCYNVTWYLSADFQLFIVSPLLVYPAIKYGWKYLWSVLFWALASSIYILVMSLVFELFVVPRSFENYQMIITWIAFPTHARLGPWMIGIVLGYSMFKLKDKSVEISKSMNAAMWIVALSGLSLIMALSFPLSNSYNNTTTLIPNAIFMAFSRVIWSIGISWIIFACHQLKTGGIIKWFLELRHFQPICRLGLSMYLVHALYQFTMLINQKQVMFLGFMQMVSCLIAMFLFLKLKL